MKVFNIVDTYVKEWDCVSKGYIIDANKYEILRTYCDVIDDIAEAWGCSAVEVNIVTKDRYICISLELDAFTAMTIDQHYFDLIERCVCFATYATEKHMVRIDLTFPSIFE